MEEPSEAGQAGPPDDLDDLADWIVKRLRESKSALADWRKEAKECYDFDAGNQWSDEDIAVLEEQRRPPIVFNRSSRTVNAVVGLEIANRQETRYLPRQLEDAGFNEMLNDAASWVRDGCDAEHEETEAFRDMAICGVGFVQTYLDYEEDPNGKICVERVDPLEVFWDPSSTKKNFRDSRWVSRIRKMSLDAVQEIFPEYEGGEETYEWLEDEEDPHDASPPYYDDKEKERLKPKTIEVVKFQWYERESFYRVLNTNGNVVELSPEKWARLKETVEGMGLRWIEQKRRVYQCAYMIGRKIYKKQPLEAQEGFTLHGMTGLRDRNHGTWFGLTRIMMDPQRWANKWLSQVMHIMNSNAKGGLLAEMGAFVDAKRAEQDWTKADSIVWLEEGGLSKIQERSMADFPMGFAQLMQQAIEAIHDTPGVNQELMGLVGHEQAGVLESMRKQAGLTVLGFLFDAMRLYKKQHGRILAELIREYISDGRLIRITGPAGAQYVPLIRDSVSFEYDVIVDEAPSSANQKERVLMMMQAIVPTLIQSGMPPPPPEIIEYLPLPESVINEWLKAMRPSPEQLMQKQQADAKAAQIAEEMRQVEVRERLAKADLDQSRAMKERTEAQKIAQADGSEVMSEVMIEREKANIRATTDIEVAKIKAQAQAYIEQMKLAAATPDAPIIENLGAIVANVTQQHQSITEALKTVAQAVAEAQQAVAALQAPKEKQVSVIRDENGNIKGAEVIELGTQRRTEVAVTRGPAGEIDGAAVNEA